MVTCCLYDSSKKKAWDEFVQKSRTPLFFFQRDFMEYHATQYLDNSYMFYEDQTLAAVLPASKHDRDLISHGGLTYGGLLLSPKVRVQTVGEIIDQLLIASRTHSFDKIIYKSIPYIFYQQPNQEDCYLLFNRANAKIVRKDMSSAIRLDNRLSLSKGRKSLIARAKKSNLKVSSSTDWTGFHRLLCSVLKKHKTVPIHTAKEMALLKEVFPQNIELKVVLNESTIIAATLLFNFEKVVHTQYIAVSELGKTLGALDYLLETIIQDSAEQGFDYFNFGISTERNGRYLNEGLVAQKEGFGARVVVVDFYEVSLNEC